MPGAPTSSRGSSGSSGLTLLYDSGYLTGAAASIDSGAGGFATTYTTLYIFTTLRTTAAVAVDFAGVLFNNVGTASYNRQDAQESGASWTVDNASGDNYMRMVLLSGSSATAGRFGSGMIVVPFYASTANKYALGWSSLPTQTTARLASGELATASAINRIVVKDSHNGGNLDVGSRVAIYAV